MKDFPTEQIYNRTLWDDVVSDRHYHYQPTLIITTNTTENVSFISIILPWAHTG